MTTPVNTSTNITDLSNGNTAGTRLGQTTTDLVSFYGAAPVAQVAGNAQAALTRGQGGGLVVTFSLTASPSSVATLTTAEQSMTPIGGTGATVSIATTDLVFTTKPTAQAGLFIGNSRASAANGLGVSFGNVSSGFLTPTGSQTYGVVALKGGPQQVITISPAAVAPSTTAEQTFAVTGLQVGQVAIVNKAAVQAGLDVVGSRVSANNQLAISFINVTTGTLTPTAAEAYTVVSLGGIDAAGGNHIVYQVTTAAVISAGVTAAATGAYNLTITNMATTDVFIGATKPTNQSGIGVVGGKVSSAGVANVYVGNFTSATVVTPTANEVWALEVMRPAPVAPMVLYSQTLTPASIATATTAEQTFTVTGVISISPVWVSGPAQPAGVGIGGVRSGNTSSVSINFINITSGTLTPTAGTYLIANFQMPIDAPGNSILQPASFVTDQVKGLSNALRSALTTYGLIGGA